MRLPFQRVLLRCTPPLLSIWVRPVFICTSLDQSCDGCVLHTRAVLLFVVTTQRPLKRLRNASHSSQNLLFLKEKKLGFVEFNRVNVAFMFSIRAGTPLWPASSYTPIADPLFPPSEPIFAGKSAKRPRVWRPPGVFLSARRRHRHGGRTELRHSHHSWDQPASSLRTCEAHERSERSSFCVELCLTVLKRGFPHVANRATVTATKPVFH